MKDKKYAKYEVQRNGMTMEFTDSLSAAEAVFKSIAANGNTVLYRIISGNKYEMKRK